LRRESSTIRSIGDCGRHDRLGALRWGDADLRRAAVRAEGNAFLDFSLTSITGMFHVPNVTGIDE
jgi:hypothetical protein